MVRPTTTATIWTTRILVIQQHVSHTIYCFCFLSDTNAFHNRAQPNAIAASTFRHSTCGKNIALATV